MGHSSFVACDSILCTVALLVSGDLPNHHCLLLGTNPWSCFLCALLQDASHWQLEQIMAPLVAASLKRSRLRRFLYFEPPPDMGAGGARARGPYTYYILGPHNNWLGRLGAVRMRSKPLGLHRPINWLIVCVAKATTGICMLISQKDRRFQTGKPLATIFNHLFGLEVEIWFKMCWSYERSPKGTTSLILCSKAGLRKFLSRLRTIYFNFFGLFVDLGFNVRRYHICLPNI